MANNIPLFYDFPRASGGISCTNKFFIVSGDNISIRNGTVDASEENIRPRIDLTSDHVESTYQDKAITFYVDDNQQVYNEHIRPKVDAGSGLMPVSVGSGIFYGVFTTANSGVPTSVSTYGVIPWTTSYNPDDVHYAHDPTDSAHNTHPIALLTGWYTITYTVGVYKSVSNVSATVQIRCKKNNTTVVVGATTLAAALLAGHGNTSSWTGLVYLNAGDSISIDCKELATAAGDVIIFNGYCSLYIKYEGPSL